MENLFGLDDRAWNNSSREQCRQLALNREMRRFIMAFCLEVATGRRAGWRVEFGKPADLNKNLQFDRHGDPWNTRRTKEPILGFLILGFLILGPSGHGAAMEPPRTGARRWPGAQQRT